ncbi:hypothetical protein [Chamaesiphon polymorphus]|uniref:Uncharacterized protein n=1 Tax=Chamaesiphon polymorphus CCALA 037 TaxID=2107692 RepID=A0A2T1FXZ1_9CYAN|nr:hypothetical protein [Chamaesiphon polymorphus]PSB49796.1 hypothetical protein C7B77_23350 [Chamaesiphon polymorphus CCALA 037]
MLQPIQLPSGKIVDLSKCIAIVPSDNSTDSEMILAGTEQQIQIDSIDLKILQQELKQPNIKDRCNFNLDPKTPQAESEYREELARKLQIFNNRWEQLATDKNADRESDIFKQILDDQRPSGQKLYSAE